jgi:soluble lytic murein transglycosylase-like protein
MGLIQQYAEQYRLEVLLVKAVVRTESCFDRRAISRAGAEGLMQLMPRTAQGLGVLNSFNARLNIEAGTRYLSQLKKRFDNNMTLALAAYNAGPHNVKKYKGIPPFKETQNYVKRIAKFHQQYLRDSIGLSAKK